MSAKRNKGLLPGTKIAGCACTGNAGNVFPANRLQRKPLVNNPNMHHGTCVAHLPWCMLGSLTRGGRENVPDIPGACATRNFAYLVRSPLQLTLNGERVSMRFHRHDGQLSNLSLNNVLVIIHDTVLSSVSNVYIWCQHGTQHGSLSNIMIRLFRFLTDSFSHNPFKIASKLCTTGTYDCTYTHTHTHTHTHIYIYIHICMDLTTEFKHIVYHTSPNVYMD